MPPFSIYKGNMKKEEKKEQVGKILIDKIKRASDTGDKGPEAREVTKEWGKKFLTDIEKIIEDPKYKKWNKIYIKILAKKQIHTSHLVNVVYGITPKMPSPDWKNMLYSYDRKKDVWQIEWILPQSIEIARVILLHEEGFDPFLVDCIKKFLDKKLPGQNL